MIQLKHVFFAISLVAMFASIPGCATKVTQNGGLFAADESVESLLTRAQSSDPVVQAQLLLRASKILISQDDLAKAREVLQLLVLQNLPPERHDDYHSLLAYSLAKGFPEDSLAQLQKIQNYEALSQDNKIYYLLASAISQLALENGIEAFKQALFISPLTEDEKLLNDSVQIAWQGLMLLSRRNISTYLQTLYEEEHRAWLELALAYKNFAIDADKLLLALKIWREKYPEHIALKFIPNDLKLADQARPYKITQIALLLPSRGPAAGQAKTLRDGFISAHLNSRGANRPRIKTYDTSAAFSPVPLYQRAIAEGADFIVGPLTKSKIEALMEHYPQVPVPTLVLNRVDTVSRNDNHFYQFGLPIEDEARQVAIRAFNEGKREAVILVPKTPKGSRASKSFVDEFTSLGGQITTVQTYQPKADPQRVVMSLLGVDKSQSRYNALRYLLDRDLKFEARRRQDVDFIFLVSGFNDAQRIKPYFDSFDARDLQIYATSDIYRGKEKSRSNKDLDGIMFCDIPWLINPNGLMRSQQELIEQLWPRATQSQARLYALGFDAYSIIGDLRKLRALPLYRREGFSGKIAVNNRGWVIRELDWARFRGESIRPID